MNLRSNSSLLQSNFTKLQEQISIAQSKSGYHHCVKLIAVSKGQSVDVIENFLQWGHFDFGESYVQELVEKAFILQQRGWNGIRWHFIGHLQKNKISKLFPWVSCVHSVHSATVAQKLATASSLSGSNKKLPVFIEVNLIEEISKKGVSPLRVVDLAEQLSQYPELDLQGLMGIPPLGKSIDQLIFFFQALRELEVRCRPFTAGKLSMGMSSDFEQAIQHGSTHIRIGRGLFF